MFIKKISETPVIPIFNHSGWCINDAWVFHLNNYFFDNDQMEKS